MSVHSHRLGPGSIKFGSTGSEQEFAVSCREVALEPETDEGDMVPVLSGDEYSDGDDDSYNLTGVMLQAYDTSAFLVWAHDNHGTETPFRFRPDNDKALTATGTVKVRRVRIGGEVKTRNESDFEFPGVGMFKLVDGDAAEDTPLTYVPPTSPEPPVEDSTPEWD